MKQTTEAVGTAAPSRERVRIVTREEWGARPPKAIDPMDTPVPYVVIHHSYIPAACHTHEACCEAMRWMQDFHQDNRTWNDIGYSFAVGGDGRAYEGRGWSRVGAHAPSYNDKSIGICVIGDWRVELPNEAQLKAAKQLIRLGVDLGMIAEDYILVTHRQVREGTECPGDRLFQEVSTWDHFHAAQDLYVWTPPVKEEDDVAVVSNQVDVDGAHGAAAPALSNNEYKLLRVFCVALAALGTLSRSLW